MKKYNVGIIGYGWAATAHIDAINASKQAQVTAIYSSRPLDSAELSAKHGGTITAYQNLDEMLADPSIHVVDITSLQKAFIKGNSSSRRMEVRNSAYACLYPSRQSVAADRIGSLSPRSCRPPQPQRDEAPNRQVTVNQPGKAASQANVGLSPENPSAHKRYGRACSTCLLE